MIIPKTLKIGGHIYEVILRDREKNDGCHDAGTCDNGFCKIWINESWAKSQQESTLLHEIIEAINFNYKLDLTETQIHGLETSLYQVLKDNNLLCK